MTVKQSENIFLDTLFVTPNSFCPGCPISSNATGVTQTYHVNLVTYFILYS